MSYVLRLLAVAVFSIVLSSCAKNSSDPTPPEPVLSKNWNGESASGKINGQAWSFQSGSAHLARKGSRYYFVIRLWESKVADPCTEKLGSVLQVRITAPQRVSDWNISPEDPFNAEYAIFFGDRNLKPQPQDNLKADFGQISIFEIRKGEVSGYVAGSFRRVDVATTVVQGGFVVPFCSNLISFGDNF